MSAPTLLVLATLASFLAGACGSLDRDVILERPLEDSGGVADAAPLPPLVEDAGTPPSPHETLPSCAHQDGGCPPPRHCGVHDCSLSCPLGCSGSIPSSSSNQTHTKSHRRPPTLHEVVP
jgi:hypothetical protein